MLGACVCLLRLFCACSHHHLPQTQSFLFLVSRGNGRRESRLAARRGGQGSSSVPLPRRQFPAKVRCPPAPAAPQPATASRCCCRRGRDRTAQPWGGRQPAGVGSMGPLQPPGMWGPPGSLCGSWHYPPEEPWGRMGVLEPGPVQTTAFLSPLPSSPTVSHQAPPPALPAGLSGRGPGSPFPGSDTNILRQGRAGIKGPRTPSLQQALPHSQSRPAPDVLSRCTVHLLSAPAPPSQPCAFSKGKRGMEGERGHALSQIKGQMHTNRLTFLNTAPPQ